MADPTARSNQGTTLQMGQQDDLITVSDFAGDDDGDIRLEDGLTFPSDAVQTAQQSNKGNAVFSDKSDKPITYEMVRPDAVSVPIVARRGLSTAQPPLITMLEAGGCAVAGYESLTTTSSTATNGFTVTADVGGGSDLYNQAFMIELDTGVYYPSLANKLTDGAGGTATLWMDLPSAQTSGADVVGMFTATPRARPVPASKLLSFLYNTRGTNTGGVDYLAWLARGCALGSLGTVTIEPEANGKVLLTPTFHAADISKSNTVMGAESYVDTEKYLRAGGNFKFELGTYLAGGDIATNTKDLIKAEIDFGLTTVPVPGVGSTTSLNGTQAYIAVVVQPTITLTLIANYNDFDDVSASTFASKYMSFVWPTTAYSDPGGVGMWFPNCYQLTNPIWDGSGDFQTATLTYGVTAAANTGGGTDNDDTAMAPWAIGVSTNGTVA